MNAHSQGWRKVNYPFIRMNPVARWWRIKFLRFVKKWLELDIVIARSAGNLALVRTYTKDLADRTAELDLLQIR